MRTRVTPRWARVVGKPVAKAWTSALSSRGERDEESMGVRAGAIMNGLPAFRRIPQASRRHTRSRLVSLCDCSGRRLLRLAQRRGPHLLALALELAAGGEDVAAAGGADRAGVAGAGEDGGDGLDRLPVRAM